MSRSADISVALQTALSAPYRPISLYSRADEATSDDTVPRIDEPPVGRVEGVSIIGLDRRRIAKIVGVAIGEFDLDIVYAIVTFGGWWGIPREYRAIPWSLVRCDEAGELTVGMTRDDIRAAPAIHRAELEGWSDYYQREAIFRYYAKFGANP